MSKLRRTLRLGAWLMVVSLFIPVLALALDIWKSDELNWYFVSMDVIEIVITIGTAICYFIMTYKPDTQNRYRNIAQMLVFVNIFNSLPAWLIAFWLYLAFGRFPDPVPVTEPTPAATVVMGQDDYRAISPAQMLAEELARLDDLKKHGQITAEEYRHLRTKLLDLFAHDQPQ